MAESHSHSQHPDAAQGLLWSERFNKLMIVLCAFLWGSSFVVMQDVSRTFSVSWVLALRFIPVGLAFLVLFYRRVMAHLDRQTVAVSLAYGLLTWGGYFLQTLGLIQTTPGKSAFLTGTYCVMVPFCAWALGGQRPRTHHVIAVCLSVVGMGFVALDNGFPLNTGDLLTLAGALCYALAIATLARWGAELDVMVVSTWEFLLVGFLSLVSALALDGPLDTTHLSAAAVGSFVYLLLLCTAFALTMFNHAITVVAPATSSLLSALESPFGVLTSVVLGVELLTGRLVVGFSLIALGIVCSELGQALVDKFSHGSRTKKSASQLSKADR